LVKEQITQYKSQFKEITDSIERLRENLAPRTGSLFVRLILGKVNVKHYRDGERMLLKQEYQKFKRKTDPLFLIFVIFQLYFQARAVQILFQVWLLYYYVTLALRENILKVNGSHINPWWIVHHYLSIALSITIVTWPPDSPNYTQFLPQFLYFCLGQGLVQILQTRYQSVKLYKLIAMEKADTMDVAGELSGSWLDFTSSVTFLLPFLLFVQFFQLYNGYTLLRLAATNLVEWQVIACGLLFLALGIGNLSTTIYTYKQKFVSSSKKSK